MDELKQTRFSLIVHSAVAVAVGWLSSMLGPLYAAVAGILVLLACGYVTEGLTKKKGIKWWFSNGIFVYLLLWIISWTVFINL